MTDPKRTDAEARRRDFLLVRIDRDRTELARIDEVARRREYNGNSGPGHSWTPWPHLPTMAELSDWLDKYNRRNYFGQPYSTAWQFARDSTDPRCRYCDGWLGSGLGHSPCAGDLHRCPVPDENGTFQQYERPLTCGLSGSYDKAFTTWTCTAGHVQSAQHPGLGPDGCRHLHCPCRWLPPRTSASS